MKNSDAAMSPTITAMSTKPVAPCSVVSTGCGANVFAEAGAGATLALSPAQVAEQIAHLENQKAEIERALEATIADKVVTYDFARLMDGATEVKTSEFAQAIVDRL